MRGNENETSVLVDGLLRIALFGGLVATMLTAPNAAQALDKPFNSALNKLDDREKKRRLMQTIRYMRSRGLVTGSYDHGIRVTKKGKQRLDRKAISDLSINTPDKWDGKWRVVFFDIPEKHRSARVALTNTLKDLDFQLLQRSIWLHPYPSKEVIARVCDVYMVSKWLTYIETDHIDHEEELERRFSAILKNKPKSVKHA